ncbi:MAG: thermonuclease family protein [Thermoplasmata archaeon]
MIKKTILTGYAVFLLCFIFVNYCLAQQISCTVTRVLDGDTFHCLPEKPPFGVKVHKDNTISVRMRGIDAPEKRQAFGEDARLSLKELIGGKIVKLDVKDIDRYGRVVAYVWLSGFNVNLEQIKRGYAWAYTEYLDRPYASEFYEAERQARKQKLGLWQQSNPTPPWEWRKRNR